MINSASLYPMGVWDASEPPEYKILETSQLYNMIYTTTWT
jgi:hypothetical protein